MSIQVVSINSQKFGKVHFWEPSLYCCLSDEPSNNDYMWKMMSRRAEEFFPVLVVMKHICEVNGETLDKLVGHRSQVQNSY